MKRGHGCPTRANKSDLRLVVRLCQDDLPENPISEVDLRKGEAKGKDRESGSGALILDALTGVSLTRTARRSEDERRY
jgi:hypothetical protein